MTCRRSGAGVGVLNGYLYAIGGHDGPLVRRSVEKYEPLSKSWTPVADMALCRRNAGNFNNNHNPFWISLISVLLSLSGVVVYDGFLYVVGGDDGTANLSSVEVYDPVKNAWSMLPACMGIGRSYAGVAVINKPF